MASILPTPTPVVCDGCGRLPRHRRLETVRVPFGAVPGVEIVLTVCEGTPFCAQAAEAQARLTSSEVLDGVPEWDEPWEPEVEDPAVDGETEPPAEARHEQRLGGLRRLRREGPSMPPRAGLSRILSLPPRTVRKSPGSFGS